MGRLKVNLDEKVTKCVALAKAIARGEGDRRLDTIHVVRAAVLAFPGEAARYFRQTGAGWSDALWGFVTPPGGFQAEGDQMPVTKGLAATVRSLSRGEEAVTLGALLKAILHEPSVRVKAFLCRVGGTARESGRRADAAGGARPRYVSRRDWLADLRTEWRLRKAAVKVFGYSFGFSADEGPAKTYAADGVLDAALRVQTSNREKAIASPVGLDPIGALAPGLDEVERGICEGILVDHLYSLDIHPRGLCVRDLAQLLSPEVYPANCRKVLEVVRRLETHGLLALDGCGDEVPLARRVRLSEDALDRAIKALASDAISETEAKAMKRAVRHGEV